MPDIFNTMYNVVVPIFLSVGLGFIFSRLFNPDISALSKTTVYVFAPCLVLTGVIDAELSSDEFAKIGILVFVVSGLMAIIGLALARMMRLGKRQESAFMLSVVLLNAANYGIPFNEFAYGLEAKQVAIVFWAMSLVVVNTLGVYLASRGTGISTRAGMLNIIRMPATYAIVVGLFFNFNDITLAETAGSGNWIIPTPLSRMINIMGGAAIPLMLLLLGIQLERTPFSAKRLKPILVAVGASLLIAPMVALFIATTLGLSGINRQVMMIEFAMPTAVLAGVYATEFGGDSEFVTSVILLSTVGSIVTLSFLVTFVTLV